jgi:2-oxoglutarate dehydrogenase E2 component (dihydrolipoamide succinyltransferase)
MRNEVVMPQMGESVTEGTVTTWFKEVGDFVERDEALLEITTDKVDSEVASPAEGVLVERLVDPGETVEVDTVIAVLDSEAEEGEVSADAGSSEADTSDDGEAEQADAEETTQRAPSSERPSTDRSGDLETSDDGDFPSKEELRRTRSTPLVRRIADEHGIDDLTQIDGSGLSGRVTKDDILAYIEEGKHKESARQPSAPAGAPSQGRAPRGDIEMPEVDVGERDRVEMMSPQRKMIAEHMVRSRSVSAHAQTVHEVDFSNVVEARKRRKEEFADRGVKLTYTAYIMKAAADALREFPMVNASLSADEEHIIYRGDIDIGMAVALDGSLIVPSIDNVDELSLLGIARRVNDLAERARNKQLKADEVEGGTFTVSNHGVFGPEFGIPIINQPQAAIVSTGAIKKRVVADQETGAIEVRPTSFWCLSFDHRVIDGATADKFMRYMRRTIEEWPVD